jgi:hypothetical protein
MCSVLREKAYFCAPFRLRLSSYSPALGLKSGSTFGENMQHFW